MKIWNFISLFLTIFMLGTGIKLNSSNLENTDVTDNTETIIANSTYIPQDNGEEMRGIWVSYITLDMEGTGRTQEEFEAKIDDIITNSKDKGYNTLIVQVRPFNDALYKSKIFPTSHIIVENQGDKMDYDPLQIVIVKAHQNGLKVHAWVNPYRVALANYPDTLSKDNPYTQNTNLGVKLDNGIYLNPAYEEVTDLIVDGVKEIVANYDVDGIQFDDYFYPTDDKSFDQKEYDAYVKSINDPCKTYTLEAWRINNVNNMVKKVYDTIHQTKQGVVFGISPQGNIGNNSSLYADVVTWSTEEGYVDYIAPQLYFSLDNPALTFEEAVADWKNLKLADGVKIYAGLAGYKAGTDADSGTWEDNNDILAQELEIVRDNDFDGIILYSYESLLQPNAEAEINNLSQVLIE